MTHKLIAGNAASITVISATVDLGSVAANTTEEETATVAGVQSGDFIVCQKPTLEAGLAILGARVSAANTVTLTVGNFTGGGIDEASETLQFLVIRPEGGSAASRVLS